MAGAHFSLQPSGTHFTIPCKGRRPPVYNGELRVRGGKVRNKKWLDRGKQVVYYVVNNLGHFVPEMGLGPFAVAAARDRRTWSQTDWGNRERTGKIWMTQIVHRDRAEN